MSDESNSKPNVKLMEQHMLLMRSAKYAALLFSCCCSVAHHAPPGFCRDLLIKQRAAAREHHAEWSRQLRAREVCGLLLTMPDAAASTHAVLFVAAMQDAIVKQLMNRIREDERKESFGEYPARDASPVLMCSFMQELTRHPTCECARCSLN